jgi:hypothetical protein
MNLALLHELYNILDDDESPITGSLWTSVLPIPIHFRDSIQKMPSRRTPPVDMIWDEIALAILFEAHDEVMQNIGRVDWIKVAKKVGRGVSPLSCW